MKKEHKQQEISQQISMRYQSPIPPASELEKYERTLPGAADRILTMAEKQSAHRQDLERMAIVGELKNALRGQILAFSIVILVIISGTFLIFTGKNSAGLTTILTGLGGLVGSFIYGTRSKRKEREVKYYKDR